MDSRNTSITITTGTILRGLLLIVLFYLIYVLRDLVLVIITAVVLASAIEPAISWLGRKRISRVPAVIIVYLVLAISFIALVYFFIPPLLNESIGFLNNLPEQLKKIDFSSLGGSNILTQTIPGISDNSFNTTTENLTNLATSISGGLLKATGTIFGGVLSFILIVVLSFYFAVIETGVDDFLRIVTPVGRQEYVVGLWKRAQLKIGFWMQGQLLLGLIVGVLVYLGLTILGVPYAFFLAILAAIFELIPVFGPIISAVPGILLAYSGGGLTLALFTLGLYVIIQQFENHLIYPLVVRKVVGIPPILVIIALIVGAELAGFLGVLLSVPVSSAIKEYIDDVVRNKEAEQRRRSASAQ